DELLKHAASLPPNSAIFWELMIVDAAGIVHEESKALTQLHAVANAPIFTYTDAFFGAEIVGGPHVPVAGVARQVAAVAKRLLSGENPADIVVPAAGMDKPKFDWRQLQRWGISEARLPAGSEVLFRSPTAWERYRPQILGVSAAFAGQALFIIWLLYERRRRRTAEMLARGTMAELHSVNRLAAAGELSASIAHEVKQPLQAAAANAYAARNWLAAGRPNVEEARSSLNRILDSVNRANDVVSGIRSMFETEKKETEQVDINDVIRSVSSLVNLHIQKQDIDVELRLDNRVPVIRGHSVQLKQVILNLVMNAIEAMHAAPVRKLTIISERTEAGGVRVMIRDTGSGIAPEDLNRIFKPLFSTKSGGMGMGLSICRSIVEAHGGRIKASTPAEGGSILEFELRGTGDRTG
ncbi:MAG: ATP-binding protein, partial [Pseudorhodoplanes sp.]